MFSAGKATQEGETSPWTLRELKFNFISFRSWLRPQNRVLSRWGSKKRKNKRTKERNCVVLDQLYPAAQVSAA